MDMTVSGKGLISISHNVYHKPFYFSGVAASMRCRYCFLVGQN